MECLPLALGLIAGIGEFIPYLGPVIAAVPAAAFWTLFAYLVLHLIEGQLAAPLIQRHMVTIAPAVMLLGMVAVTYLFGTIAIIFAGPSPWSFAAIKLIYMRDKLGKRTTLTRKLG